MIAEAQQIIVMLKKLNFCQPFHLPQFVLFYIYQILKQNLKNQMPFAKTFCQKSRKLFKAIDLFPTNNFMRYNGQNEYTTATGGFVSIAIIIIFTVMFANMGLKTIDRKIITSSVQKLIDFDPPAITLETSNQSNFMFAISLLGLNLNNPYQRLFNITLTQNFYGPGYSFINQTFVPLEPCTIQHMSFGKDIKDAYRKLQLNQSLCPPIGYKFTLGGKTTSDVLSAFRILINQCDASVDPYCVNKTVFSNIQNIFNQFGVLIPVVNVQLNPSSTDYKSYYLQDRNYFTFDSNLGNIAYAFLEQLVVKTDVSIMPYQDVMTEQFTSMPQMVTNVPYFKTSRRPYAQIIFSKAASTTTYNRSFNKIDSYFSYVGGLVGTIIGVIFILNSYTQKAYEISISNKLFKDRDGQDINSSSFNFLYYLGMIVKGILNYFCCSISWPKTESFMDCCQQINFQLDICYILKKIIFLQTAVEILFKQEQVSILHLREKYSIQVAKERRRKYFANHIIDNQSLTKIHAENSKIQNNQFNRQNGFNNSFNVQNGFENQLSVQPQMQNLSQNIQDFSAISLSRRSKDREDYKQNLKKVLRDALQGDKLSKRVVEHIDSRYYQKSDIKIQIQKNQVNVPTKFVFQQEDERHDGNVKNNQQERVEAQNFDFQI